MKPAKTLALVLALLAGGAHAAEAGECGSAPGGTHGGLHFGAVVGPSRQVFTWIGTAPGRRCRPGALSRAPHRGHAAKPPTLRHVHWNPFWLWWGQPGRHRHGDWRGHRHHRSWHGKPPRRHHGARAPGWHKHRGWGWHHHPRHARRHHWHDRRDRGHRPRRRH